MKEEVDVFTNKPVRVEDLPSVEEIFFTPLEPNYLRVRMVGALIFWVLLMVVAGTITYTTGIISEAFGWIPLVSIFLLAALSLVFVYRGFFIKGYALREKDIVYREGLIWQREIIIPFNRVQHCEVGQGPLERWQSLAHLEIYTAGGSSSDLKIPGLSMPRANSIKDFLIRRTAQDEEE